MTEPINAHTTLQMTLEMERMQHIKKNEQAQEQANLMKETKDEKALEQEKVNAKDESEKAKIEKENEEKNNNNNQKNEENSNKSNENDNKQKYKKDKGNILDIKI